MINPVSREDFVLVRTREEKEEEEEAKRVTVIGRAVVESPRFFEEPSRARRGWMSGRKRKGRNVSKGGCPWQCSCGIKDPRRVLDPDVTTLHTLVTRYCEILLSRGSSCKRIRAIGNAKRLCRDYTPPVVNSNFPVCASTFGGKPTPLKNELRRWREETENVSLFVLSFSKSLQADLVVSSFLSYLFETNISISLEFNTLFSLCEG